jgi:hypothetical protein
MEFPHAIVLLGIFPDANLPGISGLSSPKLSLPQNWAIFTYKSIFILPQVTFFGNFRPGYNFFRYLLRQARCHGKNA